METIVPNKWFIISIIELLFILYLLFRLRNSKKSNPEEIEIKEAKDSSIDMEEMMKNIHLSTELHKKLSRLCHPDRFAGTELMELANNLFQEVQQSSKNYSQLLLLKERISNELKIKV